MAILLMICTMISNFSYILGGTIMAEFNYEIVEEIAVLSENPKGWRKGTKFGELE